MTEKFTKEQIEILENAFASYPEDFTSISKYASMEGIQEQLENPDFDADGNQIVFYISNVKKVKVDCPHSFTMNKMFIGVNKSTQYPTNESVGKEPTENQIRNRMKLTQESYYFARENLREEAYGATHSKPPGLSWGDYWKSY